MYGSNIVCLSPLHLLQFCAVICSDHDLLLACRIKLVSDSLLLHNMCLMPHGPDHYFDVACPVKHNEVMARSGLIWIHAWID